MCSASCETGRPFTRAEDSGSPRDPHMGPREVGGGWWRLVEVVEERRLRHRTVAVAARVLVRPRRARGAMGGHARPAGHLALMRDCAAARAVARQTCTQEPAHEPGVRRAGGRVRLSAQDAASLVETLGSEYNGAT